MKQARIDWAAGAASALLVLSISSCATSTTTTTAGTATAPAGAKPPVKISDEPMKPEEIAAAQAGGSTAAAAAAPAAAAPTAAVPAGAPASAQAALQPAKDTPGFSGRVIFYQAGSQVRVVADVTGVSPPGNHGFHVHENGKCERDPGKDFASAGGHFNPAGTPHACPDAASHHAGDLGNIVINADGTGHVDVTTSALSLSGASSVVGRAVILHAAPDDCTTQPTGNAGGRLACGVIAASGAEGH
ncbi:MAG TPA: superoxide dismutase family protein [Thermoanaerobaculia bacterium]|nr:superoxide dismutase family protein [Thermoanaerobaculia bacterium]